MCAAVCAGVCEVATLRLFAHTHRPLFFSADMAGKSAASSMASCTSGSPGAGLVVTGIATHAAAKKLPQPKRTGDEMVDSDARARYEMFQAMVSELIADDSHVPSLYALLRKRRQQQSAQGALDAAMLFKSPNPTVKNVEPDWLLEILEKHSDMNMRQIVATQKNDPESIVNLICFATSFAPQLRMPSTCQVRPVYRLVIERRIAECGKRLSKWVAKGGLLPSGALNWRNGCYSPTWTEQGNLKSIKHVEGDEVFPEHIGITKAGYTLQDNWSDWAAAFCRKPMPPVKLSVFFKTGKGEAPKGPFKNPQFSSLCKELTAYCEDLHESWESKRQEAALGASSGSTQASGLLAEVEREKRQATSAKARDKIAEAVAAKRQRKTIEF